MNESEDTALINAVRESLTALRWLGCTHNGLPVPEMSIPLVICVPLGNSVLPETPNAALGEVHPLLLAVHTHHTTS